MTRARRPDTASNAQPRLVVDYVGDPVGDADITAIMGEYARGMQGLTGTTYAGDKGDPGHSYTGPYPVALQHFYGQAGALTTFKPNPMIADGEVTGPEAAPVYRLLADKLRNSA